MFIQSIVDIINYMPMVDAMTRLRLVSLDDTVVFPGMPVTLSFDAGADTRVFLIPRQGAKYAKAGGAAGPGTISSASSQGADAVRDGAVGPERFLRAGHDSLEVAAAAILAPVGI